ncbi:rho GTPase-activating protein 24 [Anolis carolinensis]|uniref:rho GTPase-activating protein 24 n=1 Tax=Anolis carolinensis TaxID=28377 RepID=UPI0002038758|nr:PREDICTED: rho GTPase-activating protein 24-like [Anolis carolinensis]|eukprot:XP_003217515.1 PREDICTED: rho GTPase-activating protein 24-like [Anolis carolinensis]
MSCKEINKVTEISWKNCSDDLVCEEELLFASVKCTEDSVETSKATTNLLEFQDSLEKGQMNNCKEGPLPNNGISTSQSSLQCHFVSLKQQIAQQKAEYEAKVFSLEQQNEELQLEIKDLHSKLGQHRKWYHLVEIKMRNAERAHEDAERRNQLLQKEMEEFFDTFGELTNEIKTPGQAAQHF